jgi:hypothetical protein
MPVDGTQFMIEGMATETARVVSKVVSRWTSRPNNPRLRQGSQTMGDAGPKPFREGRPSTT